MKLRWILLLLVLALPAAATPTGKKYKTPQNAVDEFIGALRKHDPAKLRAIFGKEAEPLLESEDPVNDQNTRTVFLSFYDTKHNIVSNADGSASLVVGNDAWPFPIPLVKVGSRWAFDTEAGAEEILNRRIGRNELAAIQTTLAITDAQREYYSRDRDGDGILEYAQSFRSTVGLHNGLFWPVSQGEPPSPLGELVVGAADEGYTTASNTYYGYRYRLLKGQGPSAAGGAYDYMARDNQIGGFAVLAYPATYGELGIMTFLVNHDGVVYQRDLGEETATEALKINLFDPGEGWKKVEDAHLKPIDEP